MNEVDAIVVFFSCEKNALIRPCKSIMLKEFDKT